MQFAQAGHKLAAEHAAEHLDGQKEIVRSGNPSAMIGRQATGRNNAMNMGMMQQLLIPGMQDAEEPNLSTEMLGIAGDLEQSLSAGAKQKAVDFTLVLQRHRSQLMRQCEDD